MILSKDNFRIRTIIIDMDNKLSEIDMNDYIEGFTNGNCASILGVNNPKYKILFSNFQIPNNTKFIIFQISISIKDKFYNRYFFLPISNKDNTYTSDSNDRAVTYKLSNNMFNYIWFYFTIDGINNILSTFNPEKAMTPSLEYIKEYVLDKNTFVTSM